MIPYIPSPSLQHTIEVAMYLDKPLLLCGEPGTGKTTLAAYLAENLSLHPPGNCAVFNPEVLVFPAKTTSQSTELFYTYDTMSRFGDAYQKVTKRPGEYIQLQALGKAIVNTHGLQNQNVSFPREIRQIKDKTGLTMASTSSIVLVDEIDKAPRDFPNDILNEIEKKEFDIKEINRRVRRESNNAKIFILLTSNNEKNLPDAFLRRCVFHTISFPDPELLKKIVTAHMPELASTPSIGSLVKKFNELREMNAAKKPATSEFIDWLKVLHNQDLLDKAGGDVQHVTPETEEKIRDSMALLFKNTHDIQQARETILKK